MNRRATPRALDALLLPAALACLVACGGTSQRAAPHAAPSTGPDPRSDIDFDGIVDAHDRCPDQAEDMDGWEDTDGCPDDDNDQDGIADSIDLCPDEWEDCDGFEDSDGCPDDDNDRDRIPDACDSCPNDPETYNGFEDGDGCPDHGYVIISESQIVILEHIYFQKNDATVQPTSAPILDAIAATLQGNPQIEQIAVVGHAELAEHGAHRIALRRAEAVRDALVARGVSPQVIVVHESGSSQPIDTNATPDGRAHNRRVEFLIVRANGSDVMVWNGTSLVPAPPPATPPATPPRPFVDPRAEIAPACADGRVPRATRPPPGGCGAAPHAPTAPTMHTLPTTIVPPELQSDAGAPGL